MTIPPERTDWQAPGRTDWQSVLRATLPVASAAGTTWDAVVIGAGPAGALAARELALGGARTLLVERHEFPRPKVCGACVNGHALAVLRAVGLADLVDRLGARPLRRFEVHSGGSTLRFALPEGAAVSRARFDAALVQAAIAAGAAFLPGTSATLCRREASGRGDRVVELRQSAGGGYGQANAVQARVVLAAGGLGQARALPPAEFRSDAAAGARIGLGAVLGGGRGCVGRIADPSGTPAAQPHPGPADAQWHGFEPGTISMAIGRSGYAGLVCIEGDALNVAAAVDPAFMRRSGRPATAVAELFREAGLPPVAALSSAAWSGTRPLTQRTRPLAGERVFLLGDAAGYIEPFTGEGIAWALTTAVAVVPLAREGIAGWHGGLERRWEAAYRRHVAGRQRLCRLVAAVVRRPWMARCVLGALSFSPALSGPFVRRISGPAVPWQASLS